MRPGPGCARLARCFASDLNRNKPAFVVAALGCGGPFWGVTWGVQGKFLYFGMATGLPVLFCKTAVPVLDFAVLIRPAGTGDSGLRLCGACDG
jgi:hypothetical protein